METEDPLHIDSHTHLRDAAPRKLWHHWLFFSLLLSGTSAGQRGVGDQLCVVIIICFFCFIQNHHRDGHVYYTFENFQI